MKRKIIKENKTKAENTEKVKPTKTGQLRFTGKMNLADGMQEPGESNLHQDQLFMRILVSCGPQSSPSH